MPGGDRTGPLGRGPMTGRAGGYCTGYDRPGYANPWFGRGHQGGRGCEWRWGVGGGGGYGWDRERNRERVYRGRSYGPYRGWAHSDLTQEDERKWLQEEAEFLKRELKQIQNRLANLEEIGAEHSES